MPIQIVDDPEDNQDNDYTPSDGGGTGGGGGGGGGGLISFLPMILGFALRRPKLLIPILIIGGIFYFWKGGCSGGGAANNTNPSETNKSSFSTGGKLDPQEYSKADIFNFLDETPGANPLPEAYSLRQYAPKRLNQGAQGSCVAWSNAYSIRTILHARQTGKNPDEVAFSPSFMYNQIKLGNDCQGSYIFRAVEQMSKQGAVDFDDFSYDPNNCSRAIPNDLKQKAADYKILAATRIAENPRGAMTKADVYQIKQTIAHGAPVAIGMMVGGSFMQDMMGKKVWNPTNSDYNQSGFGGHAMTIIGYDDNLQGGAFEIMNSWGPEWGENGIAWVRYNDFIQFNKEAYAYAPMGKANETLPATFDVEMGLATRNGTNFVDIPLINKGNGLFETQNKLAAGQKFKIKIKNNIECYAYVLGQELDNSAYVLYPKTIKHSPYCGVTGVRMFPRGQSLTPDNRGTMDYFAILLSKKELNYAKISADANLSKNADFMSSIKSALAGVAVNSGINYKTTNNITFTSDSKTDQVVVVVIGVKK